MSAENSLAHVRGFDQARFIIVGAAEEDLMADFLRKGRGSHGCR